MATNRRSIERQAKAALNNDNKARDKEAKRAAKQKDSFVNFQQNLGIGADNPLSSSNYGFNPITRQRTLLEWIHRGSWLGGMAVDIVADDMTRAGVTIKGKLPPEQIEKINETVTAFGVWNQISDAIKWSRLYGGCLAVMLIDGQDPSTPLRMNTIRKGQFAGLMVLDRWMVEPSLNDLVTEYGPSLGLPKFYTVTSNAPGLVRQKIHHSRCIRLEGVRLPYWQRVMENLWGLSVLERIYDRMVAFDSATTGAAQLVYKSYLRTYKVEGLREAVAAGGDVLNGVTRYVDMMRKFQNIEGITLLDGADEFAVDGHSAFSGLSDALMQFGQQLAGALQIPLVRLFGMSPAGFSTGDTDLRNYYDGIQQQQAQHLLVGVTRIYRAIALSEGIEPPEGFGISFNPLWQLSDSDKANIASSVVNAVSLAEERGLITLAGAMRELRQSSERTGIFTNITDEDIEAAASAAPPSGESLLGEEGSLFGEEHVPSNEAEPGEKPAAGEEQQGLNIQPSVKNV